MFIIIFIIWHMKAKLHSLTSHRTILGKVTLLMYTSIPGYWCVLGIMGADIFCIYIKYKLNLSELLVR